MTMTKTMPGVLAFPSSYQVMDAEEMEYVEGGKQWSTHWYGVELKLTGAETAQYFNDGSSVALILTGLAGGGAYFLPPLALVAAAIAISGGVHLLTISRYNKNNSGVTLRWNWLQMVAGLVSPSSLVPQIIDNY